MDVRYSLREYYPGNKELSREIYAFLTENGLNPDGEVEYSVAIEDNGSIIATGSYLKNVIKFVAIAPSHRSEGLLAAIMTPLVRHIAEAGENRIFIYTSPDKRLMFKDMGFFPVSETPDVLLLENRKDGLSEWLKDIKAETNAKFDQINKAENIGCIVMNCDPFTKGHRYLIERASAESDLLHIFILSSGGTFSPEDRYSMVVAGTADLTNIARHRASDYLVSPATFPTYFIKAKGRTTEVACALDIKIFTDIIAPELGIKKRFAGTEPYCSVTAEYNRMMSVYLPQHGIDFIEIPRFEYGGRAVSASEVRNLYKQKRWNKIKDLVYYTTYDIMKKMNSPHP